MDWREGEMDIRDNGVGEYVELAAYGAPVITAKVVPEIPILDARELRADEELIMWRSAEPSEREDGELTGGCAVDAVLAKC